MKQVVLAAVLAAGAMVAQGATKDQFVVSIVHDGKPVKELVENGERRVALPFHEEYKVRLKNEHSRKATARVSLDGCLVSKLGDIVIDSHGVIDLERFLDSSLTEGKRFKFVPVSHEDVDDPFSEQNGIVEVEFRLEKETVMIQQPFFYQWAPQIQQWTNGSGGLYFIMDLSSTTIDCCSTFCSATSPGATIGGSVSQQAFSKVEMETDGTVVRVALKIVGIKEE